MALASSQVHGDTDIYQLVLKILISSEKHAVVLDIGTAYTKVGYAGESSPRAILKTPIPGLPLW